MWYGFMFIKLADDLSIMSHDLWLISYELFLMSHEDHHFSRQHFRERLDQSQADLTTEVSNEVITVLTIQKYRPFQCIRGATNQNADFILHHSHSFTSKLV